MREGVNGFLVPPGAPAALARRVVDFLADPALGSRMGDEGRGIVEREFSIEEMRSSYDALYEELIGLKVPRIMYGAA